MTVLCLKVVVPPSGRGSAGLPVPRVKTTLPSNSPFAHNTTHVRAERGCLQISRNRRTIASSMMRIPIPSFLVLFLVAHVCTSFAPTITSPSSIISRRNINSWSYLLKQDGSKQNEVESSTATPSGKEESEREKDIANIINKNPFELASWYAVEAFGKAFGSKRSVDNVNDDQEITESIDLTKPPSSLEETLKRIKLDNDRSYFLSGEVDSLIYDEACIFADPFVAFSGRDRFIENLSNLGSFITNYDAKMIKYDVEGDGREIVTKVSFFFVSIIFDVCCR